MQNPNMFEAPLAFHHEILLSDDGERTIMYVYIIMENSVVVTLIDPGNCTVEIFSIDESEFSNPFDLFYSLVRLPFNGGLDCERVDHYGGENGNVNNSSHDDTEDQMFFDTQDSYRGNS